ncbi:MAG: universal stress protein [Kiloniellales bacterium]|nr:universal stress protein [Kiloniellales bacterium]
MNETPGAPLKRVLVAIDPAAECRSALEMAARLAAQSQAELVGLFVEESELLTAATLPMTRILRGHDLAEEALDRARMERGLRAWAAQAEAILSSAAARWRVKASFRVARGRIAEALLAEAAQTDLLALGTVGRPTQRRRVGTTAREIVRQAPCTLLISRGDGPSERPVRLLFEGNAAALRLADQLARLHESPLEVLVTSPHRAQAEAWARAHGRRTTVQVLAQADPNVVAERLQRDATGVAILERKGALGAAIDAEGLLAGTVSSIVLVG